MNTYIFLKEILKNRIKTKMKVYLLLISIFLSMMIVTGCSLFINEDMVDYVKLKMSIEDAANEANRKGIELADEGLGEEAIPYFEEALKHAEKYKKLVDDETNETAKGLFGDAYNNMCYAYNVIRDYEKALEYGTEAILIEPDSSITYSNRGNSYIGLDRLDEALEDYKLSVFYDTLNSHGHYGMGVVYFKQGNYQKALESFAYCKTLDSKDMDVYDYMIWCYYHLEEYDNGIMLADQALAIEDNLEIYYGKGSNIQGKEGYDKAETFYKEVAEHLDHNSEAKVLLGEFYYDNYKYDLALEMFLAAENDKLDNLDVNCWIISAYIALGEMEQADTYYNKVKDSGNATVYFCNYTGEEFTYQGYYMDSIKYFEDAILMDKQDTEAYINKISALYYGERYYRSIEFGEATLKEFEDNYDIIFYLAESHYSLSDYEEAIRWYEQALKVKPESDVILAYLSDAYAILEDYEKAEQYADKSLAINHNNTTAQSIKTTITSKQRPLKEQLIENIQENYLYYNKKADLDQLFHSSDMTNKEIDNAFNSMKQETDEFTFCIYGEDYDYDYDLETQNVEYKDYGFMKYIRIHNFNVNSDHQVIAMLDSIEDSENTILTIDLRMNGGGLTDAANNILDALLSNCVTCTLIDKDGYTYNYYSDSYQIKFKKIYILVDGYTASSSELLTLGLSTFLDNVTVIGENTYGKGVGQWVYEYKNRNLMVYLVNHFWNVREQNIMDVGITPDIYVKSQDLLDYIEIIEESK